MGNPKNKNKPEHGQLKQNRLTWYMQASFGLTDFSGLIKSLILRKSILLWIREVTKLSKLSPEKKTILGSIFRLVTNLDFKTCLNFILE